MESIEHLAPTEIWKLIEQRLEQNSEPYKGVNAVYEFRLTDEQDGTYQLEFSDGTAAVHYTRQKDTDCILKMKEKHFKKFLLGKLNSTTAFMTGKIKIDGDISLALKLEKMLTQYQIAER
ncbi:SCP2 sterol-binding domain-containing protein [Virgibacillus kekensis]|uniref:SCP2 sterol-binding domain-containing protein n=1 Tax=Virgibacillus kekensis TaxID=202261 RepID=A0ABV9DKE1_9BACI